MAVGGWALNAIQDEDTELNGKPDDWLGLPLGRAGSPSPPLSQSRFASPSANGRFGEPSLPEEDPKHPIQIPTSLASEPARYRGEQTAQRAIPTYENKKGRPCGRPFQPGYTLYSGYAYWQDSQVPPLRMASIEHAFFSASVYVGLSALAAVGAFSTVAFSMLEAPRVRR